MKLTLAIAAGMVALAAGTFVAAAEQDKSQWDGVYSEAQAKRGEPMYQQYCSSCHGADMPGG
jgi:mono/diheme cytochrome c family protein